MTPAGGLGGPAVAAYPLPPHPFLAAVLHFDGALETFLGMLQGAQMLVTWRYISVVEGLCADTLPPPPCAAPAVDVSAVRLAMSFIDITLHAWQPRGSVGVAALLDGSPDLVLDPRLCAVLAGTGPAASGAALVRDAGGIDALEQVRSPRHPSHDRRCVNAMRACASAGRVSLRR